MSRSIQRRACLPLFFRARRHPLRFAIDIGHRKSPERYQIDPGHQLREKRRQKFPMPAQQMHHQSTCNDRHNHRRLKSRPRRNRDLIVRHDRPNCVLSYFKRFHGSPKPIKIFKHAPVKTQSCQSSGGFSIPQKSLAGLSNSSPTSHDAPSRTVTASTVLAVLPRPFESNSTDTGVLFFSCIGRITPQPCAFTTTVSCFPENFCSGSRLVITTGIRRDNLVLRLAFLNLSSAVPSLELTLHPASAVQTALHTAVHTKDGGRGRAVSAFTIYENRTSKGPEARRLSPRPPRSLSANSAVKSFERVATYNTLPSPSFP